MLVSFSIVFFGFNYFPFRFFTIRDIPRDSHNFIRFTFIITYEIHIYFNKDESTPIDYNIKYVNNQPTWTNDTAGLLVALADIASWCGGASTTLVAIEDLLGNTPVVGTTVANATPAAAGTTTAGVKGYSIQFEGTGGALNGVPMDSGYSSGKGGPLGNVFSAGQAYVVPNVADPAFPNSPRVLIEYIT